MRTKMKKLMSGKSIPILAMALLVVLGTAWAARLEPISISGVVDLATFTGTATVTIGGDTLSGDVRIDPIGGMFPRTDGGLDFPKVIHEFDFEDGSTLTTTGEEFAIPTDDNPEVATLHGNMEIKDGTGVFEDASGELHVNGDMDWPPWLGGEATFEARGRVSR